MNEQWVIITYRNGEAFCYKIVSNKEIDILEVAEYFKKTEGWDQDRDNIEFINEPTTLKL